MNYINATGQIGALRRMAVDTVKVEISVVLGKSVIPMQQLLRMGRGAVIELEASEADTVEILANGHPIARGHIMLVGSRLSIELTEIIKKPTVVRDPGARISQSAAAQAAI